VAKVLFSCNILHGTRTIGKLENVKNSIKIQKYLNDILKICMQHCRGVGGSRPFLNHPLLESPGYVSVLGKAF
jgi:hypothetical protein